MLMVIAFATALRFVSLGGGLYEIGLVDRVWPARPDVICPDAGGIVRSRFWIPAHLAFEVMLVAALVLAWPAPAVRWWLLAALFAHAMMRIWSALHFIPLALRFERGDPALGRTEADRWVRASRWRLLPDLVCAAAMMIALIVVARA